MSSISSRWNGNGRHALRLFYKILFVKTPLIVFRRSVTPFVSRFFPSFLYFFFVSLLYPCRYEFSILNEALTPLNHENHRNVKFTLRFTSKKKHNNSNGLKFGLKTSCTRQNQRSRWNYYGVERNWNFKREF